MSDRGNLQALSECLAERWQEMLKARAQVLENHDPVLIHDLRVASRRLRSVVRIAGKFIRSASLSAAGRDIRKITRRLGRIRDLDEAIHFFRSIETGADDDSRRTLRQLLDKLQSQAAEAYEDVRGLLKKRRMKPIDAAIRKAVALLSKPGHSSAVEVRAWLSAHAIGLFRPIETLLPQARPFQNEAIRHELRISIKKWRYFLEIAEKVSGADCSAAVNLLKNYQAVLGDMNDIQVFKGIYLDECGGKPASGRVLGMIASHRAMYRKRFLRLLDSHPLQYRFAV